LRLEDLDEYYDYLRKDYPEIWWVKHISGEATADKVVFKLLFPPNCPVQEIIQTNV